MVDSSQDYRTELTLDKHLESYRRSSTRSRWVILILVLTSSIALLAFYNTREHSWIKSRYFRSIEAMKLNSCGVNSSNVDSILLEFDNFKKIVDDRHDAGLGFRETLPNQKELLVAEKVLDRNLSIDSTYSGDSFEGYANRALRLEAFPILEEILGDSLSNLKRHKVDHYKIESALRQIKYFGELNDEMLTKILNEYYTQTFSEYRKITKINIPVVGIIVDVNDLSLIGGAIIFLLMIVLGFSVYREFENIKIYHRYVDETIGSAENRHEKINAIKLLHMNQLLFVSDFSAIKYLYIDGTDGSGKTKLTHETDASSNLNDSDGVRRSSTLYSSGNTRTIENIKEDSADANFRENKISAEDTDPTQTNLSVKETNDQSRDSSSDKLARWITSLFICIPFLTFLLIYYHDLSTVNNGYRVDKIATDGNITGAGILLFCTFLMTILILRLKKLIEYHPYPNPNWVFVHPEKIENFYLKNIQPEESGYKFVFLIIILSQFLYASHWFAGNDVINELTDTFNHVYSRWYFIFSLPVGLIVGTLFFVNLPNVIRFKIFVFVTLAFLFTCNLFFIWLDYTWLDYTWIHCIISFLNGIFLAGIYTLGVKVAADYLKQDLGKLLLAALLILITVLPHLLKVAMDESLKLYVTIVAIILAIMGLNFIYKRSQIIKNLFKIIAVFNFVEDEIIWNKPNFEYPAQVYILHTLELYAFWFLTPIMLTMYKNEHALQQFNIPVWSFVVIGLGALAYIVSACLTEVVDEKRIARIAMFFRLLGYIIFPLMFKVQFTGLFIIYWIFLGIMIISALSMFSSLVAKSVTHKQKGTALTLVNSLSFIIFILIFEIVRALIDEPTSKWIFLILAIVPMLGLFVLRKKIMSKPSIENTYTQNTN